MLFNIDYQLDKTMCKFSTYVAVNKATNRQTYKTENVEKTLLNVSVEDGS